MTSLGVSLKFPCRLHLMLDNSKTNKLDHIAEWLPCGTAFAIHDKKDFEKAVMPIYFPGMTSYMSFRRQLNMYRIRQGRRTASMRSTKAQVSCGQKTSSRPLGVPTGIYFHPLLVRGDFERSKLLTRRPLSGTTQKLAPDEECTDRELKAEMYPFSSHESSVDRRDEPHAPNVAAIANKCHQCFLHQESAQEKKLHMNVSPPFMQSAKGDFDGSLRPTPSLAAQLLNPRRIFDCNSTSSPTTRIHSDESFDGSFLPSADRSSSISCRREQDEDDDDIASEIIWTFLYH